MVRGKIKETHLGKRNIGNPERARHIAELISYVWRKEQDESHHSPTLGVERTVRGNKTIDNRHGKEGGEWYPG